MSLHKLIDFSYFFSCEMPTTFSLIFLWIFYVSSESSSDTLRYCLMCLKLTLNLCLLLFTFLWLSFGCREVLDFNGRKQCFCASHMNSPSFFTLKYILFFLLQVVMCSLLHLILIHINWYVCEVRIFLLYFVHIDGQCAI